MDARTLDGNAVAGALREVFAVEMTTALVTCASCGASDALGALRVHRGAGVVMRCRGCDAVVLTMAGDGARMRIGLAGARMLQIGL
jgi:hypothetical protein